MNESKRLARLKTLLVRLKNNGEVSNRDLRLALNEPDFKEMQENWDAIKSEKVIKKPKQVKHYEKLLRIAIFLDAKYEHYAATIAKKRRVGDISSKLSWDADDALEKAFEAFLEMREDSTFRQYFDRDINTQTPLALEFAPRAINSKSHYASGTNPFSNISIRDVKIAAVEKAIEQIENPSNANQANNGFDEAKESIVKLNSLKRRKIDFNF